MNDLFPAANDHAGDSGPSSERAVANLRDLLLLFRRRRMLIATGTVLGTGVALALAMSSQPQYTATAAVVIDPRDTAVAGMRAATTTLDTDPVTMSTQVNVLQSREHVSQVVERMELAGDPVLRRSSSSHKLSRWLPAGSIDTLVELSRTWLSGTGIPEALAAAAKVDAEPPDEEVDEERIVDEFAKRYAVRQADESQVINISFVHPDRQQAAEIANRSAELYVETLLRDKADQADRMANWVRGRFYELTKAVQEAESAVESFRSEQGLIEAGDSRVDSEQITRLRQELGAAKAEYSELQSKSAIIGQLEASSDIDTMLGILHSPILISLREQDLELGRRGAELATLFGPRHPQIRLLEEEKQRLQDRIMQEVSRLRFELESEMRIVGTRIETNQARLDEFESDLQLRSRSALGLRELEREADANRQLSELFREYYKSISEQQGIIESDAHVLAYAKPPSRPSTLSPKMFSFIGFTVSLAGSTLLALLLESIDRRVRSARQLERQLGLRVLEAVPRIKKPSGRDAPFRHLLNKPRSAYAEAMRSVYSSLQLSMPARGPVTIVVTSAIASEGKTTLAVSLGTIAVEWGQRVLVIDLDLRHPTVSRTVGQTVPTGIVELLNGQAVLKEAVNETTAGFDLIGVKRMPTNPAGVIGDPRMAELLERLRACYDLIIIDTPPILAVSDGRIAAQFADQVVVATRWLSTPVSAVRRALRLLREGHVRIAGLVLCHVDLERYMYYENEDGANYYKNIKKYYVS